MSVFKRWVRFLLLLQLFALLPLSATAEWNKGRSKAFRELQTKWGAAVPRTSLPATYQVLDDVFSILLSGYQKVDSIDPTTRLKFQISVLESPELNAAIGKTNQSKKNPSFHLIITSQLLNELFDGALDPNTQKEAIYRLAGILAHELAHTIDKLDPHGIESQDKMSSQAIEIRTDTEATKILYHAGLPLSSLADGLALFPESDQHHATSLLGSHPPTNLRRQIIHLQATQMRYENGLNPLRPIDHLFGPAAILRKELAPKRLRFVKIFPFNKIENIESFISHLDAMKALQGNTIKSSFPLTVEQFNLILLKFDDLVSHHQGDVWASDSPFITALHLLTGIFNATNGISAKMETESRPEVIRNLLKDYGIKLGSSRPHSELKETIPAFSDSRLLEILPRITSTQGYHIGTPSAQNYRSKPTSSSHVVERSIDLLMPSAVLDSYFSRSKDLALIASDLDRNSPMIADLLSRETMNVSSQSLEARLRSTLLIRKVKQTLVAQKIKGDHELSWAETKYVTFAKVLWNNRLNWAYRDFAWGVGSQDMWNVLFEHLGDSKKESFKEQIRNEFLESLKEDRGQRFLETIQKNDQGPWEATWISVDDIFALRDAGKLDNPEKFTSVLSTKAGSKNPKQYTESVKVAYEKQLKNFDLKGMDVNQLQNVLNEIRNDLTYEPTSHLEGFPELRLMEIQLIGQSKYSDLEKKNWIRHLLFEPDVEPPKRGYPDRNMLFKYLQADPDLLREVFSVAQKYGVITSSLDYWMQIGERLKKFNGSFFPNFTMNGQAAISNSFPVFRDLALAELRKIDFKKMPRKDAIALLMKYGELLNFPVWIHDEIKKRYAEKSETKGKKQNYAGSRELLQVIIEAFKTTNPNQQEAVKFFEFLTELTSAAETDAFYEWIRTKYGAEKTAAFAKRSLGKGRIESHDIQINAIRDRMAPMVDERQLDAIDKTIRKNLLFSSAKKDDFLEELNWRLQPKVSEGPLLNQTIEKHKSSRDWRNQNAYFANFLSSTYEFSKKMNSDEKSELIRFLIKPDQVFPPKVHSVIYRQILADHIKDTPVQAFQTREGAQARALNDTHKVKMQIEAAAHKASSMEKLPIVQLLLSTEKDEKVWKKLSSEILEMKQGSLEEVLLESFIEVIPKHEKLTTLSYILTQNSDPNSKGLVVLFEVFSTVGIKLAQFSSILDVFGPEKSDELAMAKDSAPPALMQELITIAKKNFGEKVREMRLKKILGGASVKVAGLVDLPNGEEAVMIAKRPGADQKVQGHLSIGSNFIRVLREKKVPGMSRLFNSIVDAMEEILKDEMDLTREVKKYQTLYELIENYKSSRQYKSSWNLKAPRVLTEMGVTSESYFLEFIPGEALSSLVRKKQISAEDAAEVGKLIVDFSLSMFLKYGIFDSDRHKGNFLVDVKTKTVVFIDPGQLLDFEAQKSMFKWDIRLGIAKLLEAVNSKDAKAVMHYGLQLSTSPELEADQKAKMESLIKKSLAGPEDKVLLNVLDLFYESDLKFDWKVTFGIIKGMVLLTRENYVSEAQFQEILTRQIKGLYLSKLPALGLNWAKQKIGIRTPKAGDSAAGTVNGENSGTAKSLTCNQAHSGSNRK